MKLNGRSVTEGAWGAALAAHFGVPILAVSGDEAAVKEVQALVAGVEGAVVEWPYGFHSAPYPVPPGGLAEGDRGGRAQGHGASRPDFVVPRGETPVRVEIRFKNYRPAEVASWLPGVERVDAHAIRYTAKDMVEARTLLLTFLQSFQADLQP